MKKEPRWIGPKMLAGGIAGIIVSLGLCGAASGLGQATRLGVLSMIGLVLFLASLLVTVVGVVVFVIELFVVTARGR